MTTTPSFKSTWLLFPLSHLGLFPCSVFTLAAMALYILHTTSYMSQSLGEFESPSSASGGRSTASTAKPAGSLHTRSTPSPPFGTPNQAVSLDPGRYRHARSYQTRKSTIEQFYEDFNLTPDPDYPFPSSFSTVSDPASIVPGSDCAGYYCADTDTCVRRPTDCPCPLVLDTKHFRGSWYVCQRRSIQ